jgi:thiol-disulfide isomerase/thioredoxin
MLVLSLGVLLTTANLVPTSVWQTALEWLDQQLLRPSPGPVWVSSPPSVEDQSPGIGPIRVAVGDRMPALPLEDLNGQKVVPARPHGLPVVIEFGSSTCPICTDGLSSMQSVAERYAGRAEFLFVYCREAHRPSGGAGEYLQNGEPARRAANWQERRQGAMLLRQRIEPARRLLLDGFGSASLYDHLFAGSGADDALVVVAPDGRVALVSRWANADEIEAYLRTLPNPRASKTPRGKEGKPSRGISPAVPMPEYAPAQTFPSRMVMHHCGTQTDQDTGGFVPCIPSRTLPR